MYDLSVVLIGTKYTGNMGAVARVMKNFGFSKLILVDPPAVDDDAISRAMHAADILDNAMVYESLHDVLRDHDLLVGTSGIGTVKEKHFLRHSEEPEAFASDILDYSGRVALLFGREDIGLRNDELSSCHRLITVPTSDEYPIMNLSHAVSVVLYELFKISCPKVTTEQHEEVSPDNSELLYLIFSRILEYSDYPVHKRERTEIMFRRMLGRAMIRSREYHRLMGVFSHIEEKLR